MYPRAGYGQYADIIGSTYRVQRHLGHDRLLPAPKGSALRHACAAEAMRRRACTAVALREGVSRALPQAFDYYGLCCLLPNNIKDFSLTRYALICHMLPYSLASTGSMSIHPGLFYQWPDWLLKVTEWTSPR